MKEDEEDGDGVDGAKRLTNYENDTHAVLTFYLSDCNVNRTAFVCVRRRRIGYGKCLLGKHIYTQK